MAQQLENIVQVFNTNDTVTATSLNNLIKEAKILPALINDQSEKTTPVKADMVLGWDSATSQFAKMAVGNLTSSGIVSSTVDSETTKDLILNPKDGTAFSNAPYSSSDGLTLTITPTGTTPHGYTAGQTVQITSGIPLIASNVYSIASATSVQFNLNLDYLTGKGTFTSNGTTATVTTDNVHNLSARSLDIISSNTGFTGTYATPTITGATTFTFPNTNPAISNGYLRYSQKPLAPSANGLVSGIRKAQVKVVGTAQITGNATVGGDISTNKVNATTVNSVTLNNWGDINAYGNINATSNVNLTGTLKKSGSPILLLYALDRILMNETAGFSAYGDYRRVNTEANGWAVLGGDVSGGQNSYTGGYVHYKETFIVPAGETWEITWNYSAGRWTDDGFLIGIIEKINTGDWVQVFNSGQANPQIYSNIPMNNCFILTNTTSAPITYQYVFKTGILNGGNADGQYLGLGNGGLRMIRKYKNA